MATFLISDSHFGDSNAIDYHIRPFNNEDHMNEVMVKNWNRVVSHKDEVIILGDFVGPEVNNEETVVWSKLLNGNKKFIRNGNDNLSRAKMVDSEIYEDEYKIQHNGYNFYCTHDPENIPDSWNEWAIHGHSHQLHPQDYPAYSYKNKRVNVSTEQIGYTPITISAITDMVRSIENKK